MCENITRTYNFGYLKVQFAFVSSCYMLFSFIRVSYFPTFFFETSVHPEFVTSYDKTRYFVAVSLLSRDIYLFQCVVFVVRYFYSSLRCLEMQLEIL